MPYILGSLILGAVLYLTNGIFGEQAHTDVTHAELTYMSHECEYDFIMRDKLMCKVYFSNARIKAYIRKEKEFLPYLKEDIMEVRHYRVIKKGLFWGTTIKDCMKSQKSLDKMVRFEDNDAFDCLNSVQIESMQKN